MAATAAHPRDEELRDYGSGRLSAPAMERLEAHLLACAPCCQKLRNFGDDGLVQLARLAMQTPSLSLSHTALTLGVHGQPAVAG